MSIDARTCARVGRPAHAVAPASSCERVASRTTAHDGALRGRKQTDGGKAAARSSERCGPERVMRSYENETTESGDGG